MWESDGAGPIHYIIPLGLHYKFSSDDLMKWSILKSSVYMMTLELLWTVENFSVTIQNK